LAKPKSPLTPVTCGFPRRFLAFRGMAHALLLSPDDQAVNAITGVLEEMSVTCERPLDGVSAAHKLNSTNFDLVLVDCESLPAAKLIFDVCRRGNNGNNPVPIAIVDGRAGLPTAFRLGAELILTKPVAKDQARSTIRTAVSRVRKDVPANDSASAQLASAASAASGETHAHAAAATSLQLTSFADPAPSYISSSVSAASPVVAANDAFTDTFSAAVVGASEASVDDAKMDAMPVSLNSASLNSKIASASRAASYLFEPSPIQPAAVNSKVARPSIPSDDPVLAELEREELERDQVQKNAEPDKLANQVTNNAASNAANNAASRVTNSAAPNKLAAKSGIAAYSSRRRQQKTRASLVALVVLVLVGCGFYAAWMYQPGFQAVAQPQIDRVLGLAGMATPSPNPAKLRPRSASQPAPAAATDSNQITATAPDSAPSSTASSTGNSTIALVTGPTVTDPTSGVASPSAAAPSTGPAAALAGGNTVTAAPTVSKPESTSNDTKKDATASAGPLPGEDAAVILSSKGAEKRLAYSIPPKYPVEALPAKTEGTVVLKAVVDVNGKVDGVRLVEGNAGLANAAIEAVKQWRYRPYVRDGKPQSFQTVVIVDFQRP
jgi:TonB family protein